MSVNVDSPSSSSFSSYSRTPPSNPLQLFDGIHGYFYKQLNDYKDQVCSLFLLLFGQPASKSHAPDVRFPFFSVQPSPTNPRVPRPVPDLWWDCIVSSTLSSSYELRANGVADKQLAFPNFAFREEKEDIRVDCYFGKKSFKGMNTNLCNVHVHWSVFLGVDVQSRRRTHLEFRLSSQDRSLRPARPAPTCFSLRPRIHHTITSNHQCSLGRI